MIIAKKLPSLQSDAIIKPLVFWTRWRIILLIKWITKSLVVQINIFVDEILQTLIVDLIYSPNCFVRQLSHDKCRLVMRSLSICRTTIVDYYLSATRIQQEWLMTVAAKLFIYKWVNGARYIGFSEAGLAIDQSANFDRKENKLVGKRFDVDLRAYSEMQKCHSQMTLFLWHVFVNGRDHSRVTHEWLRTALIAGEMGQ